MTPREACCILAEKIEKKELVPGVGSYYKEAFRRGDGKWEIYSGGMYLEEDTLPEGYIKDNDSNLAEAPNCSIGHLACLVKQEGEDLREARDRVFHYLGGEDFYKIIDKNDSRVLEDVVAILKQHC